MSIVIWGMRLLAAYLAFKAVSYRADSASFEMLNPMLMVGVFVLAAASLGWLSKRLERHRRRWLTEFRDQQARLLLDDLLTGARADEPIFLYLRPFSSTGKLTIDNPAVVASNAAMPGSYEEAVLEGESLLRDALDPYGTLLALGAPGEHYGAGRLAVDEDEWRATVLLLAEKATVIFLLPSDRPGTLWEIQQLQERGYLGKTIILMPPAIESGGFSAGAEWANAQAKLRDISLELPQHRAEGALFSPAVAGHEVGSAIGDWMRLKERRLRRHLQRLTGNIGLRLAPRPVAGRRTDAPLAPWLSWMLVFGSMAWNLNAGTWPSWGGVENAAGKASIAIWCLWVIALALLLFLLLESTCGRLGPRALALLAALAVVATSPYSFLPASRLLYVGTPWFSPLTSIKAAVVGLLLGQLLRRLMPAKFETGQIVLLTLGCVVSARLLETLGWLAIESVVHLSFLPSTGILAGLLFGFGLTRITGWDPWSPRAGVRAPLGIEGFVIGWAIVGYVLSMLGWGGARRQWLWIVAGTIGGLAQCLGWYRQGRPLAWPRGSVLVAGWGAIAALAVILARMASAWFEPSVMPTSFQGMAAPTDAIQEGLTGLLFGVAGAILGGFVRGRPDRAAVAARQAVLLGLGFGLIGMLGRHAWNPEVSPILTGTVQFPSLALLLAVLMGTASYLEVRRAGPD